MMKQLLTDVRSSVYHSSADCEIKSRTIQLDWSDVPLNWIFEDRFSSNAMNALSYFLVDAEFSMCRLCNESLGYIQDEKLLDDLKNFTKQEALHARAHEKHKTEFMQRYGIDNIPINKPIRFLLEKVMSNRPLGKELSGDAKRNWLMVRAGLFAAAEHYTTGLADYVFNQSRWSKNGCNPVMSDLLHWHAAEEVEHRTVMFDLYQALGGTLPLRILIMPAFMLSFITILAVATTQINQLDKDAAKNQKKIWQLGVWKAWSRGAELGNIPSVSWFIRHAESFLRKNYNPVNEASTEQAHQYLEQMIGVEVMSGKKSSTILI